MVVVKSPLLRFIMSCVKILMRRVFVRMVDSLICLILWSWSRRRVGSRPLKRDLNLIRVGARNNFGDMDKNKGGIQPCSHLHRSLVRLVAYNSFMECFVVKIELDILDCSID